jgi:hypothetical protein
VGDRGNWRGHHVSAIHFRMHLHHHRRLSHCVLEGFPTSDRHGTMQAQMRKCERRMALTKADPSKWMPRLERMVQSRGLGDFEKDVLVALITSVLVPNRMR